MAARRVSLGYLATAVLLSVGAAVATFQLKYAVRNVEGELATVRGQIARAYLYMSQQYGLRLAAQQRKLFEAWDRQYPADRWECERNLRIGKLQGNTNPFIEKQCQ